MPYSVNLRMEGNQDYRTFLSLFVFPRRLNTLNKYAEMKVEISKPRKRVCLWFIKNVYHKVKDIGMQGCVCLRTTCQPLLVVSYEWDCCISWFLSLAETITGLIMVHHVSYSSLLSLLTRQMSLKSSPILYICLSGFSHVQMTSIKETNGYKQVIWEIFKKQITLKLSRRWFKGWMEEAILRQLIVSMTNWVLDRVLHWEISFSTYYLLQCLLSCWY